MGIALKILAGIGLWLVTGISTAFAQSAGQPDKSVNTLFNPVPDDQMRDFNTDRPPKANSPYTVDAGHFQYETDIVNAAFNQLSGTVHIDTFLAPNPTFKGRPHRSDRPRGQRACGHRHPHLRCRNRRVEHDVGRQRRVRAYQGQSLGQ
jgi:hypothetical protein